MGNNTVEITIKDLYQLLISECRYGYSRNNHLMPDGAYIKVKNLIPKMYEVDETHANATLDQICDECISDQILLNYGDGEDDDCGNREAAIEFVEWCIKTLREHGNPEYTPRSYNLYKENLALDDVPRYRVYEVDKTYPEDPEGSKKVLLTESPVSENALLDFLVEHLCVESCEEAPVITLQKIRMKKNPNRFEDRQKNYFYHFLEPSEKSYFVEHI